MKATGTLHDLGQSLWLDNITRELLESGTLGRYIGELSVTGLTIPANGSCTVTPASCHPRTIIALSRTAVRASCTRSLIPSTTHDSGTGIATTGCPAFLSIATTSVR